ncbi:MAG TPA: hypothetical protein VI756_15025, partial [Blastocatellia bacterium]
DTLDRLCRGLNTHPAALFQYDPDPDSGATLMDRVRRARQAKRGRPPKVESETAKVKGTKRRNATYSTVVASTQKKRR